MELVLEFVERVFEAAEEISVILQFDLFALSRSSLSVAEAYGSGLDLKETEFLSPLIIQPFCISKRKHAQ